MTTIAAYVDPETGRTWLGADSRATQADHFIVPTVCEKIVEAGPWRIAVAGNMGASALIRANREIVAEALDAEQVSRRVQALFAGAEWRRCTEHSGAPCYEQYWVLVRRGEIYNVTGSGAVARVSTPFFAEGSGREYALGAMAALYEAAKTPGWHIVGDALEIAARFDLGTGEPFKIVEVT